MGTPGTPTFPTEGTLTPPPTVTTSSMQGFLENWLAANRLLPGAQAASATIASGSITPDSPLVKVDTEGAAASDDLDFLVQTNYTEDGRIVVLLAANDARTVVVRHNQTGSGKFLLANAANFSLDDDDKVLIVRKEGTTWIEMGRFFGADGAALRTYFGFGSASVLNASATPGNDLVVQANGSGKLADGWLQASNINQFAGLVPLNLSLSVFSGANLDVTSLLNSTYDEYEIWLSVVPGSAGKAMALRISSDNGASFRAAASDYAYSVLGNDGGGGSDAYNQSSDSTQILLTAPTTFGGKLLSNLSLSFIKLRIMYLGDGVAGRFHVFWETTYYSNTAIAVTLRGGGLSAAVTTVMNAIRFRLSDGTNWSGSARVYGVKKS